MRLPLLFLAITMTSALRKVLVTGANKGIGKRIATRILTDYDDTFVYLGARDPGRARGGEAARPGDARALRPF